MNPYTQASSFMDLLTSQDTNPYESVDQGTDEESSTSVQGSFGGDAEVTRPAGVKAAKAKAKKAVRKPKTVEEEGSAVLEFQSMWEIKQKDWEKREKLSKHKLLESLLRKTELSELENALKDKLINDMLSNA